MYRATHTHTRQLLALLLIAVMTLVHVVKALHVHPLHTTGTSPNKEINTAGHLHETCSICEYHFTKDSTLTEIPVLVIAPVHAGPAYNRLITAINPDRLFNTEGRGPPCI